MYVNKCTKCGAEFETKNPKRVICPNCLYPDKNTGSSTSDSSENSFSQERQDGSFERQNSYSSGGYSSDDYQRRDDRPYQERTRYDGQRNGYSHGGGYNRPQQGGYQRPQGGGYNRPQQGGYAERSYDRPRSPRPYDRGEGYQRPQGGGYNRPQQGGYQRPQGGGFNRPQQGGYQRSQGGYGRPQQGGFNRRPQGGGRPQNKPPKQLLVNKEQLLQIEELYKKAEIKEIEQNGKQS